MAQKPVEKAKVPTGVEIHGGYLRISFNLNGKRYKESLGLKATTQNIKHAAGLRGAVVYAIKTGKFDYGQYFPNSKHATGKVANITLREAIDEHLEDKALYNYRSSIARIEIALKGFSKSHGPKRLIETIDQRSLKKYQKGLVKGVSGTTVNNHITSVNHFLGWLYEMGYVELNLSKILKKVKENKRVATPYSFEEIERALAVCNVLQHKNLITIAVHTGLRTGEIAALAWEDVNFESCTLLIRRSAYPDRGFKGTKSDKARIVDLMPPAIEALKLQMSLTLNEQFPAQTYDVELPDHTFETQTLQFVFNPKAVRAQKGSDHNYYGHRAIHRIWQSICKKALIDYREPYQLRHTYASWLITYCNINLSYLADQMGHADATMIAKVYGKWLKQANKHESERVWNELDRAKERIKNSK
ncbi:TPA: Arm DNA-binding domain-containing protein [Vibrio diabolicus]